MSDYENTTAYGFFKKIEKNLDELDLRQGEVSLDVEMYSEDSTITLDYCIETLGWVEENLEKDSVKYIDSYSFTSDEEIVPDKEQIREFLEDNFLEAALRLGDDVIREAPSPDYDAF